MVKYLKDTAPAENVDRMIPDHRMSGRLYRFDRPFTKLTAPGLLWTLVTSLLCTGPMSNLNGIRSKRS
ncbi:hypothetical protein J3R82DRAFT_5899 [Butyriboletus roseoflavus]|nr:hypothetical protein J3R82DRAFT_5899 [Butyriboletus roseoflavus]